MPASVTHLVAGERILNRHFAESPQDVQGAFLAGCTLVDVHAFSEIERRHTHFVGTVQEDGEDAYLLSCANFLRGLDGLLMRPWSDLSPVERAFAVGYLCHLAVDECWKELGWQLFQKLGINSWANFPVPGDVSLTTFDFMSAEHLLDSPAVDAALGHVVIPDVFSHVPVALFIRQWSVIREYVLARATPDAHARMLELAGKSDTEVEESRQRHEAYWESSIELTQSIGGVGPFLQDGIDRSLQVLPQLLDRP